VFTDTLSEITQVPLGINAIPLTTTTVIACSRWRSFCALDAVMIQLSSSVTHARFGVCW
jgi:hypothetical protein